MPELPNTPDLTPLRRREFREFREVRAATERAAERPLRRCIDCDQLLRWSAPPHTGGV
jgi:hypothetical protein